MIVDTALRNVDIIQISGKIPAIGGLAAGALKLVPEDKRLRTAVRLCSANTAAVDRAIQKLLDDNGVAAKVHIRSLDCPSGTEITAEAEVCEIRYAEITVRFLPQLVGMIGDENVRGTVGAALDILGEDREKVIDGAFSAMDDEKKERLAAMTADRYNSEIISAVNRMIHDSGVSAEIYYLSVRPG